MKKLFFKAVQITGIVIFLISLIFPDALGAAAGVITAGTFITTSINWGAKETLDYFLRPMFIGKAPWETQGIRVIPNIQSGQKLNYFGAASKILKAYAKGFNAASGTTYTQRTLTTYRLKAEASDDALEFYQTVFESGLRKDDWNNLDATALKEIVIGIYKNALASDIYRIFWLGDTAKTGITSGVYNGTADTDYNMLDGMWKLIFGNASTTPSDTQIKRIAASDGAVKHKQTVTLTGTSGTANVQIDGVNYLATFATNLNTTHANFVALHAAALALRGLALTGTTTIIVEAMYEGQPVKVITVTNASGDLAGSAAQTTANTAPAALAAGESLTILQSLYEGCDMVLKQIPASEKVFLTTRKVYENYMTYLETLSTVVANSKLENGQTMLLYRGIPVLPLDWDFHLEADFPHATAELPYSPHRTILTQTGNLVLGLDTLSQYNEIAMWYNADAEENRFRAKLNMGVNFVHNKLMAVYY